MKKLVTLFSAAIAATMLTACNATAEKKEVSMNNDDMYVVFHDGRYNVFDDAKVYRSFQQVGETTFRFTMIGAGPKGETVVLGLQKQDKKKPEQSGVKQMWEGKMKGAEDFYGEYHAEDGRLYVFSELADMKDTIAVGEAPYRYTMIGAGPKGQTVVLVLNKNNKKKHPAKLIEKFKSFNKM